MARVVLAMSGGVDSSVAAWLLRQSGHDVLGVFMSHGRQSPAASSDDPQSSRQQRSRCSAAAAADARRVADMLGVPFHVLDLQQEFDRLVEYFVDAYTAGRTPNPCILCNAWLKFGRLFDYADSVGAEFVATGHYARLVRLEDSDEIALCRGRDVSKDQSYVLFGIDRRRLPRLMFPLGEHCKDDVRQIARRLGLPVAERRESQDICFVPHGDHAQFVRQHRGGVDTSGEIVTADGTVVGRHDGLESFTVGQRKGLRIAFGQPRYVLRIEPQTRRVVVGTKQQLAQTELTAQQANWLIKRPGLLETVAQPPSPAVSLRCQVKIRYRSRATDATVEPLPEARFRVSFDQPRHAIAPGQAAVCYHHYRVLGGGWIE